MATISATFLNPPTEDNMELSSPRNRPLDEDIKIDFDDYDQPAADENMIDGDHTALEDEDMLTFDDDDVQPQTTSHATTTIADEDLIDYSDDEEDIMKPVIQPQASVSPQQQEQSQPEQVEEFAVSAQPVEQSAGSPPERHDTAAVEPSDDTAAPQELDEALAAPNEAPQDYHEELEEEEAAPTDTLTVLNAEAAEFVPAQPDQQAEDDHDNVPEEGDLKLGLSTTSFVHSTEGPGTPTTDTGLHPVTLYYSDEAYPLFRTRGSAEGLLKDDNLASISLADLIKAARQSLVIRTQHEIDDSFELLFTFTNLALAVSEDAPSAFQISLKDVLDVYTSLQRNDGHEDHEIPPLDIACTLQIKFNNSIVYLREAAERGVGLTNLLPEPDAQEHLYLDEVAEEYEEHFAEGEYQEYEHGEQGDGHEHAAEEEHVQDEGYQHDDAGELHDEEADDPAEAPDEEYAAEEYQDGEAEAQYDEEAPAFDDAAVEEQNAEEALEHAAADGTTNGATAEHQQDQSNETVTATPAPVNGTSDTLHPADHADDLLSEIDFDLDDYTHTDAVDSTSPSTKRQRDAEDTGDDTRASKRLAS